MRSPIVKRSIVLNGIKTSISLEDEFWDAIKELAVKKSVPLTYLIGQIDKERRSQRKGNLSSACRIFALENK